MKSYFIYTGKRLSGSNIVYSYRVLNNLDDNDGRDAESFREFITSKKVSKGGLCSITEVSLVNEGKSVSFNKNNLPVDVWKNKNDRLKWELKQQPAETKIALDKLNYNRLSEILEPVKEVYHTSSSSKRTAIIAEVIRIITTY